MKIKIVCISGEAQNGKDTVANYIKDFLIREKFVAVFRYRYYP